MTSKDETIYIKEETFNLKMNSLEKRFDKLENLIETEIRLNNQAHEHLQTSIYWGFAIATLTIGVVIAIVGFFVCSPKDEQFELFSLFLFHNFHSDTL